MISVSKACLCLYVWLSLGFSGIYNVLSTSSLTWCMWLWWYCCWCVWLVFAGGWSFIVQSSVHICLEFVEVGHDFSCVGLLQVQ